MDTYFGVKFTELHGQPTEQKKFVGTISNLLLLLGFILGLLSLLTGPALFPHIFKPSDEVVFWPFGFASIVTAFFNSYFKTSTNALIYFKKPNTFFIHNVINFVVTIGLSIWGLFQFPNTLWGPIIGRIGSGFIIFLLGVYTFSRHSVFILDKKFLSDLNKFCMPYIMYVLFSWMLTYIDRYFLKSSIGADKLASYDMLGKCYFGVEFVQNALSAILFPKIFEIWSKNNKLETTPESNRYYNVFTVINIVILLLFCIVIPFIIRMFAYKKPEYYSIFPLIGLISAGYATRSVLNFYLTTILYSKKTLLLIKIFGLSSIVQLILTFFLVSRFGLIGAIYAGLLTKVTQVIFSALLTKGIFVYNYNAMKIYGLPAIYIGASILLSIFSDQYSVVSYLCLLGLFTGLIYFIFRNELKQTITKLLSKENN
jgi:O-antigen/teichoic acid export membrane protein